MITVDQFTLDSDLNAIVNEINQATWDEHNDMCQYDVASLSAYLQRQDTIFLACHSIHAHVKTLLGIASARIEIKPYGQEKWLYVDEVDSCADQRKKGAGKVMMQYLLELARQNNCEALWLGTESENIPANALYRSLKPDDIAEFVGYTYETYSAQ